MSIVSVHGPNTFGSKAIVEAGPVQATVNPANGLIWTFRFDGTTTRVAADFDWTFTGGTPATQADSPGPVVVTYATPGPKTATLVVSGAGAGANPAPPAGSYPITVNAVTGAGPPGTSLRSLPPEEEQQLVEGYDPGDHTVDEVKIYADENPEEAQSLLDAERAGKDRTTLVSYLEALVNA